MKTVSLRHQVILAFLGIILFLGVVMFIFGYHIIHTNIVNRAHRQVRNDLNAARSVFNAELELMGKAFDLIEFTGNPGRLKRRLGLDYFFVVERDPQVPPRSAIVSRAFAGNGCGGVRVIDSLELISMGNDLVERSQIDIRDTPKARATRRQRMTDAMALEYAVPFFDSTGAVARVVYGGKIINRYFDLVDRIHDIVYENRIYMGKPAGTVTIFQDDVRISTNVITSQGERAIGTRVSESVYHKVVEEGNPWYDRAFVVTDWYITAYEPIRDITGRIIGVLYVGILEQPFRDMTRSTLIIFLWIMAGCTLLSVLVSVLIANAITRPLTRLAHATYTIAAGDLSHRIPDPIRVRELHELAGSFNEMAAKIDERDKRLTRANAELEILNKRYLDLVGMVSHELKGILSSTILNACSVADGYLGELNETQKKALNSVVRSLEYFDLTVKNFLDLSRIEKGELVVRPQLRRLREDIVDITFDALGRQAQERGITMECSAGDVQLHCDKFLMLTVLNNLVGNALKYGRSAGRITVTAVPAPGVVVIEVYNEGRPLSDAEREKLFARFTRLDSIESRREHGTGLGLFLCRQIVQAHNGTIECQSRLDGNAFVITVPSGFKAEPDAVAAHGGAGSA